ncbi:MAG: hypothetical protein AB2A00_18155 [Myxococcota bacterium]
MLRNAARLLSLVVLGAALLYSPRAHAQYRDNGIIFEAGVETYEFLPYTLTAFAASEGAGYAWDYLSEQGTVPARNRKQFWTCSEQKRFSGGAYGFPCQNNWFGLGDGFYGGLGYQRVIGDLLLDLSEAPILRNLVVTGRGLVGMAPTLAGGGKMFPLFFTHAEAGIRWNILDERIRPYVAMNAALNVFIDVFGFIGRYRANQGYCAATQQTVDPNGGSLGSTGCVGDAAGGAISFNSFSPQAAAFYLTSFPGMGSLRPEAGIEWFPSWWEDISLQFYLSPVVYGTILPQFILRPPFVGLSARAAGAVVVYF